jgi:Cdc6-like AAA superfamily ATPase
MHPLYEFIGKVSQSTSPVLVIGATGTGKRTGCTSHSLHGIAPQLRKTVEERSVYGLLMYRRGCAERFFSFAAINGNTALAGNTSAKVLGESRFTKTEL